MPTVVVEISDGDLVDEVYDEDGNGIGFIVIDHTMWEGGDCPFCDGHNTEYVESRCEVSEIGVRMWYGGHARCLDCGRDENSSVVEWIKEHRDIMR
jgi:hypothetical protein